MTETGKLADLITRVTTGDPWHASSLVKVLDGVTADTAASHPVPGAHSIWELVLHITGWADEVRARLAGRPAGEPAAGDWPAVTDMSGEAWRRAVAALVESHDALAAAIRASDGSVLDTPVTDQRDPAAGAGLTKYLTLHGLAHHTVYHTAQIALLVKSAASR